MILKESVEGCADCAAEEVWKLSQGHECGLSDPRWHTWCEVLGESRRKDEGYHRASHKPLVCEACGKVVDDHRGNEHFGYRRCPSDQCDEWFCKYCDETIGSAGDVCCPTCGSDPAE